ncbi:MAG: hypothetical protein JXB13_11565 [Phycisphaerae bacterium]|nr:hypothetical protein [Phycisphaerae bacterium]
MAGGMVCCLVFMPHEAASEQDDAVTVGQDRFAGYEIVVNRTHRASLEARERGLRGVLAKETCWPDGAWGETLWTLSALYLDEKTEDANARLLKRARTFLDAREAGGKGEAFTPETAQSTPWPWAYFALPDYVRTLCLFRAGSPHFPGRLRPETEAAMKEALWLLVKTDSKVADAAVDNVWRLLGTENHDLVRRSNYYLVASILRNDPAFRDRRYDDGHTAAGHCAAYTAFYREWARQRAMHGIWMEIGSDTYQKYSWPTLLNLAELSPDALVRARIGMLLDLAFIEEAQISIRGRRGGGRSRAHYGENNFEAYKNLLYAPEGAPAGSSHSKVIETSRYQLPAAAILLRTMAFPAERPFVIQNRVLGEVNADGACAADSALVNYAYRTPHYLLGCTLQNPALSRPSADGSGPESAYSGISRQNRWCGLLFDDPEARFPVVPALKRRDGNEMCAVYPEVEKTRGGRPQHSDWCFQHENVLFIQRISPQNPEHPPRMGSYSTGRLSIRFHGKKLERAEEHGWIFVSNGKAFAAVKFLDGGYQWDEARELASPAEYDRSTSTTRVLLHAGDVAADGSFEAFRAAVLAHPLTVEPDRVAYRPAPTAPLLECFRYVADAFTHFRLPQVDGRPVHLRPEWTYRSPYLNGRFGDDRITVTVGPVKTVYDLGSED